jgi:hypothetical protein
MKPWSLVSLLAVVIVGVALSAVRTGPANAATVFPSANSTGFDVSYVQCGSKLPNGGSFAVVGVNHGLPWSTNTCLSTEFGWANSRGNAALYMNTANPAPHSSFYWPASGSSDPALCRDNTSVADSGCAYNYGWHAAESALNTATAALGQSALSVAWWLDVETTNSWNGTQSANAADIQGSIDYLRFRGVPAVGIYSTGYQWSLITCGYSTAPSTAYVAARSSEFTPLVDIGQASNWIAGLSSLKRAQSNCRTSFSGGRTVLAQYQSGRFDADYACG